jgi:rare lipoprotein A
MDAGTPRAAIETRSKMRHERVLNRGGIMTRWLAVLSIIVMQSPAIAGQQAQEPQAQVQPPAPPEPTGGKAGCTGRQVVATSYGKGQRTTSSGERFDPHGMTAAHRTLPFGTRVTVTNPRTGKSVIVVVNDRGPSAKRIEIDISIAAAKAIGLDGTGAVCIEQVVAAER